MANTVGAFEAHEDATEYEQTDAQLRDAARRTAQLMRDAHAAGLKCGVYVGAGISTAAGQIADFRGPQGVWTLRAKGVHVLRGAAKPLPNFNHHALIALLRHTGASFDYITSTNCDGLLLKARCPPRQLLELHGNKNVECCALCGRNYLRAHRVRTQRSRHHKTGRTCECGGALRYTTIAF
eukprot:CAMPEP_0198316784 /NCGR_PEP_ID=MMETSP1450-20131203/6547_1 /TAXON_ID=753684 ORGANISM="Madagascaria erythrocladiodes, Strain CCMP3234" /NCGR_SAMPLE_ID=MMETSP1450 /ASSEMBLY_ACC=CAM_ASM_001115 /LENGTH=180 /DNA_ID=CAMNT_0044019953 /DNA_START=170 /DNA_END=709 /DNA_ORIENTATION=+